MSPKPRPEAYDPFKHGVSNNTLSMLARCPEETSHYLRGIQPILSAETLPMRFGSVFHRLHELVWRPQQQGAISFDKALARIEQEWIDENTRASAQDRQKLEASLAFAVAVFPEYMRRYPEDRKRKWVFAEHPFRIPIRFPWYRDPVPLIGFIDGGFLEGKDETPVVLETKTKARIDPGFLEDWLKWDLQTNIYLYATRRSKLFKREAGKLLYNIVRRPQLRQKRNETLSQFALRCAEDVKERPEWYFFRIPREVTPEDIDRAELVIEERVDGFIQWWRGAAPHYRNEQSCDNKYGLCKYFDLCAGRTELYSRVTRSRRNEEITP